MAEFHLVFSPWALWIFVSITKQLVNIYSDHRKLVLCAELDKIFRITTACKSAVMSASANLVLTEQAG